jgi:hypothetical protein
MSASRLSLPIASPEGVGCGRPCSYGASRGRIAHTQSDAKRSGRARLLALIMMEADAAGAVEAVCGAAA